MFFLRTKTMVFTLNFLIEAIYISSRFGTASIGSSTPSDPVKLKKRAERFGGMVVEEGSTKVVADKIKTNWISYFLHFHFLLLE